MPDVATRVSDADQDPGAESTVDFAVLHALDPVVAWMQWYFDADVRGLERLPPGPALLVGNHSGNVMTPDTWIFARAFYHHTQFRERLVGLGHEMIFRVPGIGDLARSAGVVEASPAAAERALADGAKVLVYPGGGWEACRPSRDRDRVDFHGRQGFVRLALAARVPIVPIVTAGAHDGWWVLTRGERLARWLGLKARFRIDTFPVALGLPTGVVVGPCTPFLPLPTKIVTEVLPPIELPAPDPASDGAPDSDSPHVQALYDRVTEALQGGLSRLAATLPGRGGG